MCYPLHHQQVHTSSLLCNSGSIWVSMRVKGSRHKQFLSKSIHHSSLLVKDLSGWSGYSFIHLIVLAGDVERNLGPFNDPMKRVVCPVCEDTTQEAKGRNKGQYAIFCDSSCKAWIHRCCAGLSTTAFGKLADSNTNFYCPTCCLTTLESVVKELKQQIQHSKWSLRCQLLIQLAAPCSSSHKTSNPSASVPSSTFKN